MLNNLEEWEKKDSSSDKNTKDINKDKDTLKDPSSAKKEKKKRKEKEVEEIDLTKTTTFLKWRIKSLGRQCSNLRDKAMRDFMKKSRFPDIKQYAQKQFNEIKGVYQVAGDGDKSKTPPLVPYELMFVTPSERAFILGGGGKTIQKLVKASTCELEFLSSYVSPQAMADVRILYPHFAKYA